MINASHPWIKSPYCPWGGVNHQGTTEPIASLNSCAARLQQVRMWAHCPGAAVILPRWILFSLSLSLIPFVYPVSFFQFRQLPFIQSVELPPTSMSVGSTVMLLSTRFIHPRSHFSPLWFSHLYASSATHPLPSCPSICNVSPLPPPRPVPPAIYFTFPSLALVILCFIL